MKWGINGREIYKIIIEVKIVVEVKKKKYYKYVKNIIKLEEVIDMKW